MPTARTPALQVRGGRRCEGGARASVGRGLTATWPCCELPLPATTGRSHRASRRSRGERLNGRFPASSLGPLVARLGQVLSLATDSYMARHVGAPQPSLGGRTREHFQRQVDEGTYLGRQVAVARVHREHLYCRRLPRHQDGQ
jgi:hypothetical protein